MLKTKKKRKIDFYILFFWIGLIIVIASYFFTDIMIISIGLVFILLSLLAHEMYYSEKKGLEIVVDTLTLFAILFVVYSMYNPLLEIMKLPFKESWLVCMLVSLFIVDAILVIIHIITNIRKGVKLKTKKEVSHKIKKKEEKEAVRVVSVKKRPAKKIKSVKPKKKVGLFFVGFIVGIIVTIVAYLFGSWIVFCFGCVVMAVSLIGYRVKKEKIFLPLKKEKIVQGEKIVREEKIVRGQKEPDTDTKRMLGLKIKEEKSLQELIKRQREKERIFREKERLIRKEERKRERLEKRKGKDKEAKLKSLKALKDRLEDVKNKKEKIRKDEERLSEKEKILDKKKVVERRRYETDFDALLRLVERYGSIKITEVMSVFGIEKEKAEEWARILEEANLIRMHYPAVGVPEIRKCQKK